MRFGMARPFASVAAARDRMTVRGRGRVFRCLRMSTLIPKNCWKAVTHASQTCSSMCVLPILPRQQVRWQRSRVSITNVDDVLRACDQVGRTLRDANERDFSEPRVCQCVVHSSSVCSSSACLKRVASVCANPSSS